MDINPACKAFEEENIKIMIGSQEDTNFLNELKLQVPKIDILIDDGGHTMNQQITTFNSLFNHISEDGVYLNAWHSESPDLKVNEFTLSSQSLHYYDCMLFIGKRKMTPSFTVASRSNQ